MKATLHANAISCKHCAMTITRELSQLDGISFVAVDVDKKSIDLHYADDKALAKAKETLDEIGYPVS